MMILAHGLSVTRSGRTILQATDVDIRLGERVGLVGASGSGKSTLGTVLVDALPVRCQSVAHVPQSPDEALDPLRSMAFHWREAEYALGLPSDPMRRDVLFKALGIEGGDLRKRPWGWSRGMPQRVVIAMGLLGAPDLLVIDEPTSALDPIIAARTMDLLDRTLEGSGTALLLITHDLGLAVLSVDKISVDYGGRAALRDVSLSLTSGQTLAVVGESGAGKSTLIGAILGLVPCRAGAITWEDDRCWQIC